jgi:hypothetical protein
MTTTTHHRRFPLLLALGIAAMIPIHLLHFANVLGFTRHGRFDLPARIVTANITPLAWCAYLLTVLGLLTVLDGPSYLRRFRNRFLVCWLWSVPAWCYFDWMNFYFMRDPRTHLRAWEYINLPPRFDDRLLGYLLAFGAIAPGMFLSAELLMRLGFWRLRSPRRPHAPRSGAGKRTGFVIVFLLGLILAPIPVVLGGPASNLAIWVGTWALLDPINGALGRPSIVADWFDGRWGRTLALGAGGLLCGFLWEFWNYWSTTKWVYHLPFLGPWEHTRYFEMPLPGLIGFIAFGIETWTMWQTSLLLLAPFVEGERHPATHRGDRWLAEQGCF